MHKQKIYLGEIVVPFLAQALHPNKVGGDQPDLTRIRVLTSKRFSQTV